MSESNFYHFSESGLFYGIKTAEAALEALNEGGFIWLNYYNPPKEDFSILIDKLGVHPLSVEDCLDASQVPKMEHFPESTFFIFNSYTYKSKELYVDEVDFILGKNFLITVSGINSDDRKPLDNIGAIVEKDPGLSKSGPAFLMHVVLDYVVDEKFNAFEAMEEELEESEDAVIDNTEEFQPSELIRLRKYLVNLRKSLFHEREILIKICRMDCPFVPEKAIFHYRDIYDHLAKFFEMTDSYRELVTSLMELYSSLLNNLMTKMSNRTNASVKRLTLIATIFMPLTLLSGIGGMSEWSMITGPENWRISYPLFLLGMLLIAVFNYFVIKRLEKKRKPTQND